MQKYQWWKLLHLERKRYFVRMSTDGLTRFRAGTLGAGGIPKSKYQMSAVLTEDPSFIIATLIETFVSDIKTTDVTLYLIDPQY